VIQLYFNKRQCVIKVSCNTYYIIYMCVCVCVCVRACVRVCVCVCVCLKTFSFTNKINIIHLQPFFQRDNSQVQYSRVLLVIFSRVFFVLSIMSLRGPEGFRLTNGITKFEAQFCVLSFSCRLSRSDIAVI